MSNIFERDYQMLELDRDANWRDTRENYRRLVNRWHPDRYASRPREKQHAQARFIEVTKSYNSLRSFYKEHSRLPLQDPATKNVRPSRVQTTKSSEKTPKTTDLPDDEAFAPNKTQTVAQKPNQWLWFIPIVGLIVIATLFIFLEMRLNEKNLENAVELKQQSQSGKFTPKN